MAAYYNEHDQFAAEWLRQLIKAGHIADGVVDERSIIDVDPEDVREFTQCHWFAGIGTWSYALRSAGWDDNRPVWTGSPPCQPFSAAGKQKGKDDERHLAPHWLELVTECGPAIVFGEQVAAAIRHGWFDDLQAHLEAENYAVGVVVLPACGIGAPHIRQRQWVVAQRLDHTDVLRQQGITRTIGGELQGAGGAGPFERLGNTSEQGLQIRQRITLETEGRREEGRAAKQRSGAPGGLGNAEQQQSGRNTRASTKAQAGVDVRPKRNSVESSSPVNGPSPTNGFWRDPDWLYCRDGKWRPVESGTFPLVNGAPARVGRLRGYGNGIVAPLAQAFIEVYMS